MSSYSMSPSPLFISKLNPSRQAQYDQNHLDDQMCRASQSIFNEAITRKVLLLLNLYPNMMVIIPFVYQYFQI
jgi:hypothetical protein